MKSLIDKGNIKLESKEFNILKENLVSADNHKKEIEAKRDKRETEKIEKMVKEWGNPFCFQ